MRLLINEFCVYTHDIGDVIFYVGKGKNYRPFDALSRTDIWKNHVQKNGGEFNVNIIRWYKKETDALLFERRLISKHKPTCNIQCNLFKSRSNQNKLLGKHIEKSGLTITEYAKSIGVSMVTMYHALRGNFSPETAQKIYEYTDYKVELIIKPKRKDA